MRPDGEEATHVKGEDGLTARQRAFVQAFVFGKAAGNISAAARAAGYSGKSAPQIGAASMKLPAVSAAIDAELRLALSSRLSARAIGFLSSVLDDADASDKLKADVSLKLVEFSGLAARAVKEKGKETGLEGGQRLQDMSRADLEALVRNGAAVLKAAAALPSESSVIDTTAAPSAAVRPAIAAE